MVQAAASVDWVTVGTEVEALQVEYSWIKQYEPRFNVRYRDDKSYPYLAVTLNEAFPRIQVMRGAKRKGVKYFGPYAHAWAIRDTVDQLLRVFPMRSCSAGVFQRHQRMQRACLLFDLGKCSAPCIGVVTETEHRLIAEDLCRFMSGNTGAYVDSVRKQMQAASDELDFESAARLRDNAAALGRVLERSAVVLPDHTDADVVGLVDDELEASIQVFHVRSGRVTGQRSFIVEKSVEQDPSTILEQFLVQLYGESAPTDGRTVPRELLVSHLPEASATVADFLSAQAGRSVRISVPSRGPRRILMETVTLNAAQALNNHKVKRASDLTARSRALQELQDYLELPEAPLRIECIDISGHHGEDMTASIIVFEDGLARKSSYRKYRISDNQDDLSAMYEAVHRRFKRMVAPNDESPEEEGEQRDRYRTSLLVVDGALGQAKAANRALTDLGVDSVAVVGLAKRLEEVWVPGAVDPVILPRRSESLYLLQRLRDEAHRFAINFHRQRRAKRSTQSELDEIPGLGPAKRKALLAHFGSVRRIRAASVAELSEAPGIGPVLADAVARSLALSGKNVSINVTTGEIRQDGE